MPLRVSLRDWPRLTRFYGIPPKDLARMPYALLNIYAEALLELAAEEALEAMTVADMPYMKESDRNRVRGEYAKQLEETPRPRNPTEPDEPLDPRSEHAAAVAARFGISVDTGIES